MNRTRVRCCVKLSRVLLLAPLVAGCQLDTRSKPVSAEHSTVQFQGKCPVWIFIPAPSITDQGHGFAAEIALKPAKITTNHIELTVEGEVAAPGTLMLPAGFTTLQAIGCAGGFTEFAHNRKLEVRKISGQRVTLYLHATPNADSTHLVVWYASDRAAKLITPRDNSAVAPSDHWLEEKDRIIVPRTN